MTARATRQIGVPIIMLHEGEGLVLTVETRAGYTYRGECVTTEDNMNISLKMATATDPAGVVSNLERVMIRGSQILFIIFPDAMSEAPMFRRVALQAKGVRAAAGLGRGRLAKLETSKAKHGGASAAAAADSRGPPRGPFMMPPPYGPPPPYMMMMPPPGFPGPPRGPPPPGWGGGPPPGGFSGGPPPGFPGGPPGPPPGFPPPGFQGGPPQGGPPGWGAPPR